MALTRRGALIERLKAEAARSDDRASLTCFEILCGLPVESQAAAATHLVRRFLPHYEQLQPGDPGPRRALDDPTAWVREHGRSSPLSHDPAPLAESAFDGAFDGLFLALCFHDDAYTLTSGCTYAIRQTIAARAYAVWVADEPIPADMFRHDPVPIERPDPHRNAAWLAVTAREWCVVASWLSRTEVVDAPDPMDPDQIAQLLARWIAHHEIIVVPSTGPAPPTPRPNRWDAVDARVTARVEGGDQTPIEQILGEEIAREQDEPGP